LITEQQNCDNPQICALSLQQFWLWWKYSIKLLQIPEFTNVIKWMPINSENFQSW